MKSTTMLKVELGKDHQGRDILLSLRAGTTMSDPWPYRVTVEWDKAHRLDSRTTTDTGCRTREHALAQFGRGLGYLCEHQAKGRPCRHFTPAAEERRRQGAKAL